MIILLDEQVILLIKLLNAVIQGENYSIRECEQALEFLTHAITLRVHPSLASLSLRIAR